MTLRLPLILLSLLFVLTTFLPCRSADQEPHIYPLPIAEIASLVLDWLADSGLEVEKTTTMQGLVLINGSNPQGSWKITLEPRSVLSTAVSARYSKNGTESVTVPDLYDYLQNYPQNLTEEPPGLVAEIPVTIRERVETSVCLRTEDQDEPIEFSGFFIDKALILSTAHGLIDIKNIAVTDVTGGEHRGDIIKLDPELDLALIKIDSEHEKTVPLETGRNLLKQGEIVYSVGCPAMIKGMVHAGTIIDPPRRVGRHPFWQVSMVIQPGSSGSPVFDIEGALVAMVKGRYRGTDNSGFLIPLQTIMDFLNDYFAKCNTDAIK